MIRAITLVALVWVAGYMTLRDEQEADYHYAEMVCGGHWPNYDNVELECLK